MLVAAAGGLHPGHRARDAPLQLLVDATNVTQAQAVESYLQSIVQQTVQDDLKLDAAQPPIQFRRARAL